MWKDDVMAEMDANMIHFIQMSNKTPKIYIEELWNRALRYDLVHNKYLTTGVSIEGLVDSVDHSLCLYWDLKMEFKGTQLGTAWDILDEIKAQLTQYQCT